jgi:predicted AAA+ superfamily ATPase
MRILITGSARLEAFRQSGDSLAGRFFRHRLLPLSLSELPASSPADMDRLVVRGGFPEPFLAESAAHAERWRMQYIDGLIRNDVLDFEKIHDFKAIQLVMDLLRRRVGSPVSYSSIAEDVQVSYNTVKKYIQILEALFIVFRITPYSRNIARSLLKEPKIYFFDTGMVLGGDGPRFENFTAVSLLKYVYETVDLTGKDTAFHYFRTREGKEADFCIVQDGTPEILLETKSADARPDKNLRYFHAKYGIPACQLVRTLRQEKTEKGLLMLRAEPFLRDLPDSLAAAAEQSRTPQ